MPRIALLLLLLVWVVPVLAEDFVCEDTVEVAPKNYRRNVISIDPSKLVLGTNELCTLVPDADIQAQRAACVGLPDGTPPTIPTKYRKVVNHLCVEMTAAEKQPIDAAQAAIDAQNQAYATEKADQTYCAEKQLQQIDAFLNNRKTAKQNQDATAHAAIDAEIDALTTLNLAVAKDILKKMTADYYARVDSDRSDEYGVFSKLARCLRAQVGLRQ